MLSGRRHWTPGRVAAWGGLILLLAAYAHLAFRQDSSFFTVWWMPREMARQILRYTDYRNFWGFGLLGFYSALFLGASLWIWRKGRWPWGALIVLLLPVLKEMLQIPTPGRHGTWHGALYGVAGSGLGLMVGSVLRCGIAALWSVGSRRVENLSKGGNTGANDRS